MIWRQLHGRDQKMSRRVSLVCVLPRGERGPVRGRAGLLFAWPLSSVSPLLPTPTRVLLPLLPNSGPSVNGTHYLTLSAT